MHPDFLPPFFVHSVVLFPCHQFSFYMLQFFFRAAGYFIWVSLIILFAFGFLLFASTYFFSWGNMKSIVYDITVDIVEDLLARIEAAYGSVRMLQGC